MFIKELQITNVKPITHEIKTFPICNFNTIDANVI